MTRIKHLVNWVLKNFFFITGSIFIFVYLRWFRLTPLVFKYHNDPNRGYIFGIILLFVFLLVTAWLYKTSNDYKLRFAIDLLATVLFIINSLFLFGFFPSIVAKTKCNGITYYITTSRPLSDPQWTFYQFTKWKGLFNYKSFFFGYSGFRYEFVCDEVQREANVIIPSFNALDYTDGESPRSYYHSASTKMKDKLYFLTEQCNNSKQYVCETTTYSLVSCNLDYKSCNMFPIQYTDPDDEVYELEANEAKNEIILYIYDDYPEKEDKAIIFTYGEHPRCYVKGCEILQENNP